VHNEILSVYVFLLSFSNNKVGSRHGAEHNWPIFMQVMTLLVS